MGWAVLLAVGGWVSSRAAPLPPMTAMVTNTAQTLDYIHDDLNARMQLVTRNLDSFFKRADASEAVSNSTGRIRLSLQAKDADGLSPKAAFSGKVVMPYAEERLHLFLDNIKRGALPSAEQPILDDNAVQVGARLKLLKALRSQLHLEGGLRLHGLPDPFTQLEFAYERKLDGWVGRFTQDAFYYVKEGAGELTQVDLERAFRDKSFFRSTTAANYTEKSHGVEFEHSLSYDYPLPGHCRHLIPSAGVFAHKCGPFLLDNYIANVTYRTCFFRPWLVLELTPQIEFPRERDYTFTPSLRIGFEIWLGSLPEDR
jgi:hypothetical protein